jgi:hypothetical protein
VTTRQIPATATPELDRWVRDRAQGRTVEVSLRSDWSERTPLPAAKGVIVDLGVGTVTLRDSLGKHLLLERPALRSLETTDHVRGALEGLAWGLAAGVLVGSAIAISQGAEPNLVDCGYPCTVGEKVEFLGAVFGSMGAVVGATSGAIVGHRHRLALTW